MIHIAIAYIVTGTVILFTVYLRQRYQNDLAKTRSHLNAVNRELQSKNTDLELNQKSHEYEIGRMRRFLESKDADIAARDKDIESFAIEVVDLKDQLTRFETPERSAPVKRTRTRTVKK
jgi:predicted  nucleic acid-binding Zn-ribbon protein